MYKLVFLLVFLVREVVPDFTIGGLLNLRKGQFFVENSTQMYDYDFTNDETIKILCDTRKTEKTYNLAFYLDKTLKRKQKDISSLHLEFTLSKDNRQISCIASDKTSGRLVETHIVRLHYNSQFERNVSAKVDLSVTGLPDNSCAIKDKYNLEKTCNFTYNDPALIGTIIPLQCTLAGPLGDNYTVTFGTIKKTVQNEDTDRTISKEISLTGKNETGVCQAMRSSGLTFTFTVEVHIYYIPPPSATTEPSTSYPYEMSTEVGPQTSIATCPVITWIFWLATGTGVVLFVALVLLVITIMKCREIAKNLEETENELRQIEARETEMAILAHRPVMRPPPEIVYDRVYAHGAGLMRKPF